MKGRRNTVEEESPTPSSLEADDGISDLLHFRSIIQSAEDVRKNLLCFFLPKKTEGILS